MSVDLQLMTVLRIMIDLDHVFSRMPSIEHIYSCSHSVEPCLLGLCRLVERCYDDYCMGCQFVSVYESPVFYRVGTNIFAVTRH